MAAVEINHTGQTVEVVLRKYSASAAIRSYSVEVVAGMSGGGIPYEGEYEVIPDSSGTVLLTRAKTLRDDVTVHPIPYIETSNDAGGLTVSIAS